MLGLNPGQGHKHWSTLVANSTVVVLCLYPLFSLLMLIHDMVFTASECTEKPLFLVIAGAVLDREHINADPSSSICSLNRKISRKALKVITLDKKGICSRPERLIQALLSYFWGTQVTGVRWNFWAKEQCVCIKALVSSYMLVYFHYWPELLWEKKYWSLKYILWAAPFTLHWKQSLLKCSAFRTIIQKPHWATLFYWNICLTF